MPKYQKPTNASKTRHAVQQAKAWRMQREMYEVGKLSDDQRLYYYEAKRCGASHNDAMEAAETNGYQS